MKRTKLKERCLPNYTKGEEIMNMTSHIVGGIIGITSLVLCLIFSVKHHNGYGVAGSIVFGIITIRCHFCHRQLHLKGIIPDEFCPFCGEKLK